MTYRCYSLQVSVCGEPHIYPLSILHIANIRLIWGPTSSPPDAASLRWVCTETTFWFCRKEALKSLYNLLHLGSIPIHTIHLPRL